MDRLLRVASGLALLVGLVTVSRDPAPVTAQSGTYNWLQFNGDAQHSGDNTQETLISQTNVGSLHQALSASLPSMADGAPVYLSDVVRRQANRCSS